MSISFSTLLVGGMFALLIYAAVRFRAQQPSLADELNALLTPFAQPVKQPLEILREHLHRGSTLSDDIDKLLAAPEPPKPSPTDKLRTTLHGPPASGANPSIAAVDAAIAGLRGAPK